MKMLCLLPAVIFLAGCDQRSQPLPASSSISLLAFKGRWEGAWVWKPSESSIIIFDGNQIKLKNLPIDIAGKLEVLNSEALAEEAQGYGASNTLAVLARPKGYNASIAIFAYGDSSGDLIELRYSVREHFDERIIFRRSDRTQ